MSGLPMAAIRSDVLSSALKLATFLQLAAEVRYLPVFLLLYWLVVLIFILMLNVEVKC